MPFVHRQRPMVHIQKSANWNFGHPYHCFTVYTSPCNDKMLPTVLFSSDLKRYVENLSFE
jgi:hypothetical protein